MAIKFHKPATAAIQARWRVLSWLGSVLCIVIAALCFVVTSLHAADANSLNAGAGTNTSYVLTVNDLVELKVYKEDDLSTKTRVDQDGTIALHLIGLVPVSGRTIAEAREAIRARYEKDYLVSANVTLTLLESSRTNKADAKPKLKFTARGEVKKPGVIEFPDNEKLDLVNAIALAGDFTTLANQQKVTVRRTEGNAQRVYELDVRAMIRDVKAKPFEVKPGDVIEVRQTVF